MTGGADEDDVPPASGPGDDGPSFVRDPWSADVDRQVAAADSRVPPAPPTPTPIPVNIDVLQRSADERRRRVHRLANPWYRQLARGLIALCLLAGLALGGYVVVTLVQDQFDGDELPAAGFDTPAIRQSSYLVVAASSALALDGTLTVDHRTGAFEFVGRAGGPNADDWFTSPDGDDVYSRRPLSRWELLPPGDRTVADVRAVIAVLAEHDTVDTILTDRIRRGFVDLDRMVEEGTGDDRRSRYEITLHLDRFATDFPAQWDRFRTEAVPGVRAERDHRLTLWVDTEHVLVRVDDQRAGWQWERLAYAGTAFEPVIAADDIVTGSG